MTSTSGWIACCVMYRPMKYASAPTAIAAKSTEPTIAKTMFWNMIGSGVNEIAPLRNGCGGSTRTPNSVAMP